MKTNFKLFPRALVTFLDPLQATIVSAQVLKVEMKLEQNSDNIKENNIKSKKILTTPISRRLLAYLFSPAM